MIYPSWGLLVRAPESRVRQLLSERELGFELALEYRTHGEWTSAFCMEPGESSYDAAAELLRRAGLVPVYRFDFSKYGFFTYRWDGEAWKDDRDAQVLLGELGIDLPGWKPLPSSPPVFIVRYVVVVEGVDVERARGMVPEHSFEIEPGPRGAIVYATSQHGPSNRTLFWQRAPRVIDIRFNATVGEFTLQIIDRGETSLGTFEPGATRTWDGTPFLPDFEGDTEPAAIIAKLGIRPSFLERQVPA